MGAWGNGPFDNDSASDIMWDIREGSLEEWLEEAEEELPEIDNDNGSGVFAVAALLVGLKPDFFDEEDEAAWSEILSKVTVEQKQRVKALMQVTFTPGQSEFYELWSEAGDEDSDFQELLTQAQDILNKL